MRTIRTKVYQFDELTPEAQQKAIENLYDINVNYDWWEGVYEDANNIGLKLTGFDFDSASFVRNVEGEFITSAGEVVETILNTHGNECETYKTALNYKNQFQLTSDETNESELEEIEDAFLYDLLIDYKNLLQEEYDYQTTKEAIIETITANEYEFTSDGRMI